ncbi:MAG: type II toxin-antitoxin system ParD family antitoxin [Bacteroidales bacterium]|nr:type II toxin-antitoxin system ParD family antitoxin [Bacteroidales bacterium]
MSRTTTVSLGSHYEDFIRNIISQGRYNNVSEVIREGLRRLEEDEARLAALRAALEEGEASPDVTDFDPEAFLLEMKAKRHRNG